MPRILKWIAAAGAVALFQASAATTLPEPSPRAASAPQLNREDLEAWLDGLAPYALHQGDIAGLVVSVVKDGEVLLEKGYGYADVVKAIPMDPERTVVRGASVSKSFTATAVMQLVEQGKVDLDRDVNQYLDFRIPAAFGKPITLRNLLTHTSGFEETAYRRYRPSLTLRQYLLMIPDRIRAPGEITAYSNYGLDLAGYIVQRVSGEPISDYVERHVLSPLGMSRSTFHLRLPASLRPFEAKNYPVASSGEPFDWTAVLEMVPVDSPSGGLATTAHDMTRFMLAHLQQGRYGDYQLLRPQTMEIMHAPAFVPVPGASPVALGLFRYDYKGHPVIGHSGDGEGAHSEMKLLPEHNIGIFTAMNSDGAAVQGFLPAAFSLRTMLFEQFMDRYFPTPPSPQEPTASTAREHAQTMAGEYAWSRQQKGDYQEALSLIGRFLALDAVIRANADGTIETPPYLTFEKNGRRQKWREVGPFVWREVGGHAHLFTRMEAGKVQAVWTDQVPPFWVDVRVPRLWSGSLNVPLFVLAATALLATVLLWPVAAIVRRRHGRTLQLAGREHVAYRWTRFAALLGVLYVMGWAIALVADFASTVGTEPWVRLIQLIGLVCVAGAGIAVWNAWLTMRGGRSLWAKAWSVVLALALLYLVWFSFAFHLISARLN